jgi:CO/xanthine dehydrogenase FAD-binding subunit
VDAYLAPGLDEALGFLEEWPGATPLAGGTDLMVDVNAGRVRPDRVLSLRRVPELQDWEDGRIGAGVTWRRLQDAGHSALAQAARTIGSPQIRNAGTIGGNVGTASPAGDGLAFLAAADALIELASANDGRRVPWDEFFVGVKETTRRPDELITALVVPDDIPGRQAFGKVGIRSAMVISIVVCCVLRDNDGATRVALGSVAPTPMRARDAERMISEERRPSAAALDEFARLVAEEVRPITDHRSTAGYRRHAAGVLARRLLERVL